MDDFKEWRESSLAYHKASGIGLEFHCSVFFIKARKYFDENGFPEPKRSTAKTTKGKTLKWTKADAKKQQQEIHDWINERR